MARYRQVLYVEFQMKFMHMGGIRLRGDIGGGLFSYAALRSFEKPYISAWWLRLFGGVMLAGDPAMPEYGTRDLYGMVSDPNDRDVPGHLSPAAGGVCDRRPHAASSCASRSVIARSTSRP